MWKNPLLIKNQIMAWLDKYSDETPKAQKGKKVKPIYVDSSNDPRYRAYQDSLALHNYSLKRPNALPGEKPVTKQEFIKKNNTEKTFKYYDIKGDEFEKDAKSKKNKSLKNYYKEKGISPNYIKNIEKAKQEIINANYENLIPNRKLYTDGVYRGDKNYISGTDYDQFQYDPITGTTTQNIYLTNNNKQSKHTGVVSSNKIKPIGVTYSAYDNPLTYNMIQSNNEKVENKTFGLHISPYYKKPTTPVIVDKNKYKPNDPRLLDLQERLENTLLKPQPPVILMPTKEYVGKNNKGNTEFSYGYDKPRQHLENINITPQGYAQNNIGLTPNLNITPQARIPQYFNVTDKVNQNFGGTETNYRWYPDQPLPPSISNQTYDDGTPMNIRQVVPVYMEGGKIPVAQNGIEGTMRGLTDKGFNYNGAWGGQFQGGGNIPGSVGFTYARTQGIPSEGKYGKKTMSSAQNGQEMRYYQEGLDFRPKTISKKGSVIKDDLGQWAHPGEITEIGSNQITMEGVPYPVLGISDKGDVKLMQPGKNYKFKGKKVTEFPMAKNGINNLDAKPLQKLDDLTNFTNYNSSSDRGWLSKYE